MPKLEPLPENEARDVEISIRTNIMSAGANVSKVVDLLNREYTDRVESAQTISRQLKQGIIPAWKERRIAHVLGYTVRWSKRK